MAIIHFLLILVSCWQIAFFGTLALSALLIVLNFIVHVVAILKGA